MDIILDGKQKCKLAKEIEFCNKTEFCVKKNCLQRQYCRASSVFLAYKKMYLQTNNTASTYISGVIFSFFPQITLMIT